MSTITKSHWLFLGFRTILFVLAILNTYIDSLVNSTFSVVCSVGTWLFFIISMVNRLFPAKKDTASMGNQKIFKKNFIPTDVKAIKRDTKSAVIVALVWLFLNSIFAVLYFNNIIDNNFMLLLSLFYSVCDIICIVIYCPFQRWFMKNKCCTTCRIYNWDYIMMFTPLVFVPNVYNYSLFIMSLIVFIMWEVTYYRFPERFHEETNDNLKCKNCKEFMCRNKFRKVAKN